MLIGMAFLQACAEIKKERSPNPFVCWGFSAFTSKSVTCCGMRKTIYFWALMTSTIPDDEEGYFVPTLNQMGYATTVLDRYSQSFVVFCAPSKTVIDIGAAYGAAVLPALSKGATVIANDIDEGHLSAIKQRCNPENLSKLTLDSRPFPDKLDFAPGTFDAILCCRVIHFFSPQLVKKSFEKFAQWLKPEGKLFLICESPYLKNFSAFIPIYEKQKAEGHPFPGFIEDAQAFAAARGPHLPKQVHWFDPDVFKSLAQEFKFHVELAEFFARPQFPADIQLDGRESVALIATKNK
jgi:SAM-dependent methyltransferase